MACEAGAFTGRDVVVYYAIGCPESQPANGDYKRLGMMRGKTVSAEWDTADATADMSAAYTQENLVTYKNISFSGDGVTRKRRCLCAERAEASRLQPAGRDQQSAVCLAENHLSKRHYRRPVYGDFVGR